MNTTKTKWNEIDSIQILDYEQYNERGECTGIGQAVEMNAVDERGFDYEIILPICNN